MCAGPDGARTSPRVVSTMPHETPGDPPPPGATLDSIVLGAPLMVTGQSCAALAENAAARERAARDAALHGLLMSCESAPTAAAASPPVSASYSSGQEPSC